MCWQYDFDIRLENKDICKKIEMCQQCDCEIIVRNTKDISKVLNMLPI